MFYFIMLSLFLFEKVKDLAFMVGVCECLMSAIYRWKLEKHF